MMSSTMPAVSGALTGIVWLKVSPALVLILKHRWWLLLSAAIRVVELISVARGIQWLSGSAILGVLGWEGIVEGVSRGVGLL